MHPSILTLGDDLEQLIPIVGIAGGLIVAVTSIIACTIKSITRNKAREESRREIAAYIAEGSMTAEDGQKLLEAGMPAWEKLRNSRI